MEYALPENMAIFAGGLGVLAGDLLLAAGEKDGIDFKAIGIYYETASRELEKEGFTKLPNKVSVTVEDREVTVVVWSKSYGRAELYLLSTNTPENNLQDREITREIYGPDQQTMLAQQLVLGIGGIKLIKSLGVTPAVFHLNEGHTAFALLGLATEMSSGFKSGGLEGRLEQVKSQVVATKHTIFPEAGYDLVPSIIPKVSRNC